MPTHEATKDTLDEVLRQLTAAGERVISMTYLPNETKWRIVTDQGLVTR